ncbi:hypothetical protein [Sphaerisporangium album]|uniref:hypothetical protein n=1 Tax=Sphaerisporangium album TaxID=509200 RepID=UPI0015F0A8AC|nr:hypothetical protein [Sphaerisporangium album]
MPQRRHHQWEHPTTAQMRARLEARKRLGLYGPFLAGPFRPVRVRPFAIAHPGRQPWPAASALSVGIGRAPDIPPPIGSRGPSRRGVAA